MYILNIGLDGMPAEAGESIGKRALFAARALRAAGFVSDGGQVFRSDSEPTLVVKVQVPGGFFGANWAVFKLSETLGQDCIGMYSPGLKTGKLVGPEAAAWGDFNPEFFILPNGERLAQPDLGVKA